MSLILATGSNVGNKEKNLLIAKNELSKIFNFLKESRIYESEPVDYLDQDTFYNQVLEFSLPEKNLMSVKDAWATIKEIQSKMGRVKIIDKGPRSIDIDILFWGLEEIKTQDLIIPHQSWKDRSFVVFPLSELPFSKDIKKEFGMPKEFKSWAEPI